MRCCLAPQMGGQMRLRAQRMLRLLPGEEGGAYCDAAGNPGRGKTSVVVRRGRGP